VSTCSLRVKWQEADYYCGQGRWGLCYTGIPLLGTSQPLEQNTNDECIVYASLDLCWGGEHGVLMYSIDVAVAIKTTV